jgi:putative transposase
MLGRASDLACPKVCLPRTPARCGDLVAPFLRSQGESQADWEALLQDLYRRGLEGKHLGLIVTDGCPGLAAAIQSVYPRARHQRCWVHKMRNLLEHVRQLDYDR